MEMINRITSCLFAMVQFPRTLSLQGGSMPEATLKEVAKLGITSEDAILFVIWQALLQIYRWEEASSEFYHQRTSYDRLDVALSDVEDFRHVIELKPR